MQDEEEAGGQGSAGREDKKKAGASSGRSKDNRQSPRTKAAMTQRDGEPHKVDYTRLGFETLYFLEHVFHGSSRGHSYHHVNSGITAADIAAPSTSEPNSAQKAPNGSAPVRKFTAP